MVRRMIVKCGTCGYTLNVAGLCPRPSGTRPCNSGVVPPEGMYEWGRYQCHGCGETVIVPEIEKDQADNRIPK